MIKDIEWSRPKELRFKLIMTARGTNDSDAERLSGESQQQNYAYYGISGYARPQGLINSSVKTGVIEMLDNPCPIFKIQARVFSNRI